MVHDASAALQWRLYHAGHELAGVVVRDHLKIEAQVVLDGSALYCSRHRTQFTAEEELASMWDHYLRDGWMAPTEFRPGPVPRS